MTPVAADWREVRAACDDAVRRACFARQLPPFAEFGYVKLVGAVPAPADEFDDVRAAVVVLDRHPGQYTLDANHRAHWRPALPLIWYGGWFVDGRLRARLIYALARLRHVNIGGHTPLEQFVHGVLNTDDARFAALRAVEQLGGFYALWAALGGGPR